MPSQHKRSPVTFRPPEGDRLWLYEHAKQAGRSIGAVLSEALAAYRATVGGNTPAGNTTVSGNTTAAAGNTTAQTPRRKQAPKRPASEATPAIPAAVPADCGHTYPDVRHIAGQRVCRKYP